MYREKSDDNFTDSGWIFLVGNEVVSYINDPDNCHIFSINTLCNYDEDFIPCLDTEVGTDFVRIDNSKFEIDDGKKYLFISRM